MSTPYPDPERPRRALVGDSLLKRRRHLPHWQVGGSVYFVTFRSDRGILPAPALRIVQTLVLGDDGNRYELAFGVIMPDHVHLMFKPLEREPGVWWDLADILKWIKGTSARQINLGLGTEGRVWQKESFDRIVRDDHEYWQKWQYMYFNPVKAGLVDNPDDYEFLVRP